jgi:3-phenylpropionate/trans-cinnamate dioxygenase ferredoxin reductase subunit
MTAGIVIIGAGHAGGTAAAGLRQAGYKGPVTLVGEEPLIPYQRPPLSKAWLKGEATAESLELKPARFYAEANIELRLSAKATAIDRAARVVTIEGSAALPYEHLILATGSRLRKLPIPGNDLAGILELRNVADAERIKAALRSGVRLAVVGGGYIGLEVAASARALGAEVTVIEREARVLARVASPALSRFYEDLHRAKGVRLLLGATVSAFDPAGNHIGAVRLASGETIACDVAVVGIGALAEDRLAQAAGLACDDGIVVDLAARTSDANIFAIGDCTKRPLPLYGRSARLESVPNALEQAKQAAAAICVRPAPATEVPWFWSDQYDAHLQMAGLSFDVADTVLRGEAASGHFALFHLDAAGHLQAVEAVNSAAEFMGGRIVIAKRKVVDRAKLADASVPMKSLIA